MDEDLDTIEMARRLYRGLEMQAGIMRDPARTGDWPGAARVAAAFERQAEAAKRLHDALVAERERQAIVYEQHCADQAGL